MTKFSMNIPVLGSSDTPPTPDTDRIGLYAKNDTDDKLYYIRSDGTEVALDDTGGGGGAPDDATYIVQTANGTLTNEQALGALATGVLKSTTTTGVVSIAAGSDLNTTHGSQTANHVYAAPDGSGGNPSFRALVADDIPTLPEIRTLTPLTEFSSNTAIITISSIPSGYGVLNVLLELRSDRAASVQDDIAVEINDDTTAANYITRRLIAQGASVTTALTNGTVGYFLADDAATASTATATAIGYLWLRFPGYATTTTRKTISALFGTQSFFGIGQLFGSWSSTAAITKLDITPINGSNFTEGRYMAWLQGET